MSEASDLLATLRDISEPPAPQGVPPTLVFANVALALLVVGLFLFSRHRRRNAWRRTALAHIEAARREDPEALQLSLAKVLRRVMQHRYGRSVDALHGEAWLTRLDQAFGGDWFTRGAGRAFGDQLYTPRTTGAPADPQQLATALTRRLKRLPNRIETRATSDEHNGQTTGAGAADKTTERTAG